MLDIVKNNPLLSGVNITLRTKMIFNHTIITIITSTTGIGLMGKR